MKSLKFVLGLCVLSSLSFAADKKPIIGGDLVTADDLASKSTVALRISPYDGSCSAVIIADDLVLSAAHCLEGNGTGEEVVFNFESKGTEGVAVVAAKHHPDYTNYVGVEQGDDLKNVNDIAVFHFKGGLPEGYQPAVLLDAETEATLLADSQPVTLAGYGVTEDHGDYEYGTLRQVNVTFLQAAYSNTQFTVDQSNNHGACYGDSGGPAYVKYNDELRLVGLTQGGWDCHKFGIYTKVSAFWDWVQKTGDELRASVK